MKISTETTLLGHLVYSYISNYAPKNSIIDRPPCTDSPIQRVGDYAFLFDLTILLCHRPKWLQHRYRFREAIKIRDNFLENPATMNQPVGDSGKFCVRLFSKLDPNHRVTLTLVADSQVIYDLWFYTDFQIQNPDSCFLLDFH